MTASDNGGAENERDDNEFQADDYAERFSKLARHSHKRVKFDSTSVDKPDPVFTINSDTDETLAVDASVDEIANSIGRTQPASGGGGDTRDPDSSSQLPEANPRPLYNPIVDFRRASHNGMQVEHLERDLYKDVARITHSPFFRILAGKTQLFPIAEHSLVRNRLTHSLEVSDISKRITERVNREVSYFANGNPINRAIVSAAGLAHDIGHPPFAHSGEECLAELMRPYGGFESNAQTLRVLARLEQRLTSQKKLDRTYTLGEGLNLSARTIASVLKYDWVLFANTPGQRTPGFESKYDAVRIDPASEVDIAYVARKGYYREEAPIIERIKYDFGLSASDRLYTLECSIMDIADDIAYSTYDLEDAMIVGLLHPFDVAAVGNIAESGDVIRSRVNTKLRELGFSRDLTKIEFSKFLYGIAGHNATGLEENYDFSNPFRRADFALQSYIESKAISQDRAMRRRFTEDRISKAISGIAIYLNTDRPLLSTATLENRQMIETLILKEHNFERVIKSPQLKIFEMKVKRMLTEVFFAVEKGALDAVLSRRALREDEENDLYLDDDPHWRKRLACDVICAMTERDVLIAYEALTTGKDLRATELHLVW